MTKSKSGGLARLPRDQKSQFLIGPVGSWFMSSTTDLWTQANSTIVQDDNTEDVMDCDKIIKEDKPNLSYFAYGSIGCFCYGEIYHRPKLNAIVNKLIDVKDDNSRVACVRFLKKAPFPLVLALTESGSLLIHDCFKSENLIHFKKTEVLKKFMGLPANNNNEGGGSHGEHGAKRTKFEVTQQINSCSWPRADTILLGVSLLRDKTCLVLKLKLVDVLSLREKPDQVNKNDAIQEHHKIDLALLPYPSPICLVESAMLDDKICVMAVGMEDGVITVVVIDLDTNKTQNTIKFERHHDQICSLSLNLTMTRDYPLGILASVSRDGLVRVSNIEKGSYFAVYQAAHNADRESGPKFDWFALRLIEVAGTKRSYLAVSNTENSVSLLEIPEEVHKSKARLKPLNAEPKARRHNQNEQQTLKHSKLIFNIEYDPLSETVITSSLDGDHLLWSVQRADATSNSDKQPKALINLKPQFLYPAMLNTARTHMLRHNAIKEDLMCLALGKGGVKFYQITANLADSRFDMTPSCALVARKLAKATVTPTSLAWHPNHEYRLAIGTIEGSIFRADITPRKAALIEAEKTKSIQKGTSFDEALGVEYKPIMRGEQRPDGIYSLCWGPNPASPQDVSRYAIYAVGSSSHKLSIFCSNAKDNGDKLTNYLDEFQDKSLPEALDLASEVAWKPSMDLMALGTIDGRVIIASFLDESHQERSNGKLFKILTTIKGPLGSAFVQCLVWHPTADNDDPNYYKIVASSNESPAFVFNLKEAILVADVHERLKLGHQNSNDDGPTSAATPTNMLSAYVNKLDAHQKAISDIAWNPHEPNQVATCSFDRTCFIWSLDNCLMDAQIVAKFSARDRLFTLEWSLVDTDLVYVSGNDSVVWAWRPSENRVRHQETATGCGVQRSSLIAQGLPPDACPQDAYSPEALPSAHENSAT